MKKIITFMLSLLVVSSLAACGSQTVAKESSTAMEQTEISTFEVEEMEENEESSETVETIGTEKEAAFDISWANNDYEKQMPELPFANWRVVETPDENDYCIQVLDVLYTDAKEYGERLIDCAFTQDLRIDDETEGINYYLQAENESGYSISYDFNAYSDDEPITGMLVIELYDERANENVKESTTSVSWGDSEIDEMVPGLPEAEWEGKVSEKPYGKEYHLNCYDLTKEEIMDYAEVLKKSGFNNKVDETPNEYLYRFMGSDVNDKVTVQVRIGATANAEVLLTEVFATINK